MSSSLWPNLTGLRPPRGMIAMLYDAAGDIAAQTHGEIDFHVDPVGVGVSGLVEHIRHNCYLRIPQKNYMHLLFQVTTPVATPFPATAATPEGDEYLNLKDENDLRDAIREILQRERTKEIVLYLKTVSSVP